MNLSFSPPLAWNTVPTSRMPYGLKSWLAYPLCDCRYNVNVWVYLRCHKNSICLDGSRIRNSLRIASVSVRFRSKERGTRVKDRAINGARREGVLKKFPSFPSPTPSFIFGLSFQFSRSQNPKSRSSVFLCLENYRKSMLRSLNPQRNISRIQKYPDTCEQCPRILLTDNIQSGGNCSVNYYYWQGITEALCQIIISTGQRITWDSPHTWCDNSCVTVTHTPCWKASDVVLGSKRIVGAENSIIPQFSTAPVPKPGTAIRSEKS